MTLKLQTAACPHLKTSQIFADTYIFNNSIYSLNLLFAMQACNRCVHAESFRVDVGCEVQLAPNFNLFVQPNPVDLI